MTDPSDIGRRVLANLAQGRARAIAAARARAAAWHLIVRREFDLDVLRGYSARGRAGRIRRRLQLKVSERQIQKYLEALASGSDSVRSNRSIATAPDDV